MEKSNVSANYKGLLNQNSSGNLRYRQDAVNMTMNSIKKLKTNLENKPQNDLAISGAQPPMITQNEPPVLRPHYRNSSILNQKDESKTFSGLQKGRSYSTANLQATKVYTQAIADTKQFIQQNYMKPPPKRPQPKRELDNKASAKRVNDDIDGVLHMEFPSPQSQYNILEHGSSSSEDSQGQQRSPSINFLHQTEINRKEQDDFEYTKTLKQPKQETSSLVYLKDGKNLNQSKIAQKDILNSKNGYSLSSSQTNGFKDKRLSFVYDQNIHKNGITIDSPPKNLTYKFRDLEKEALEVKKIIQSRDQEKEAKDVQKIEGLEEKAIEANVHHLWVDFMNERKQDRSEQTAQNGQLVIKHTQPVMIQKSVKTNPIEKFNQIKSTGKLFSNNFYEERDQSSSYDPESYNYIYKNSESPKKSNMKQFLFFGYNGNYPENQINALTARGCWKILQYKEQLVQCNKIMHKKIYAKSQAYPQEDLPEKVSSKVVDEHIIDKANFIWRPCNFYESAQNERINKRMNKKSEQAPLIYNHFENMSCLGSKSGLIKSMRQYYYTQPEAMAVSYNEFDTTATTYVVLSQKQDGQTEEMQLRFKQIARGYVPKEKLPMKHCIHNLWLVKPSNANQGRGIELFSNLDMMMNFINSRPAGTSCVVQKYIERPLLYHNRKFDLRVWAVVTNNNEIYFYREGYLRTSSNHYSLESSDLTTHLTNQCLQIKDKNIYGIHEEGNTLSYYDFQEYLDSPQFQAGYGEPVDIDIYKDLVPRMKDIVIDTFLAVKNQVNPNRRKNQFELFGYDFMIDEDFRVWLIEVNTNPYLGKPNKWTKTFVPNMVDEMFQIVLDPIYPPKSEYYQEHRVKQKKFELIYAEGTITNKDYLPLKDKSGIINERRQFDYHILYPIPSLMQTNQNSVELKNLRDQYRGNISGSISSLDSKHKMGQLYQKRENTRDKRESYLNDLMKQSSHYKRKTYRPSSAAPTIRRSSVSSSQTPKPTSFKKLDLDQPSNLPNSGSKQNQDLFEIKEITDQDIQLLNMNKKEHVQEKQFDPFSAEQRKKNEEVFSKVAKVISNEEGKTDKKESPMKTLKGNLINESKKEIDDLKEEHENARKEQIAKQKRKQQVIKAAQGGIGPTGGTVNVGGEGIGMDGQVFKYRAGQIDREQKELPSDPEEILDEMSRLPLVGELEQNSVIREQPEEEPLDNKNHKSLELSSGDEEILADGDNQDRFHKLIRQQKFDLISQKLEEFWKTQDRPLQVRLFFEIFNSICQKYFLEEFGQLDEDSFLNDSCKIRFQQMISQFGELLNEEVDLQTGPEILKKVEYKKKAPIILKTKQIDILIEILMNENLCKHRDLIQIIVECLNKQTKSIYQKPKNTSDTNNSLPQLSESSFAVKDHLLKKAHLRKLLVIHKSLQDQWPVQYMMERVFINLTSIAETRVHLNSTHLQKLSTHWRRQMKNNLASPSSVPDEVKRFRMYEDIYHKCLVSNGLLPYLISGNCSQQTYTYLLQKVLTKYDIEALQQSIENHTKVQELQFSNKIDEAYNKGKANGELKGLSTQDNVGVKDQSKKGEVPVSQYMKFVDKNVDFNNLKSRLRLVYKQKFEVKQRSESAKSQAAKQSKIISSLSQIKEVTKEAEKILAKKVQEKSALEVIPAKTPKSAGQVVFKPKSDTRPKSAAQVGQQRGRQMAQIKQVQQNQLQPTTLTKILPSIQPSKPAKIPKKLKDTIEKQPEQVQAAANSDKEGMKENEKNVNQQTKKLKKKKSNQTTKSNEVQTLEKFKSPLEAALKKLDKLQEQLIQKVELNQPSKS